MKKYLLILLTLFSICGYSQRTNTFKDSSIFYKAVVIDSNLYITKGASNGKVLTSNGIGLATWQTLNAGGRFVDTIYKNSAKDSIVFTISGIRYAVKDSSGGSLQTLSITRDTLCISGESCIKIPTTIFQNGFKVIESAGDYILSSADAGYCLVTLQPSTNIITPLPCPFNVGDIVGVAADRDTTTLDVNSEILGLQILAAESAENGEVFIMQCVDIGGDKNMSPLTAIKSDNGTLKTISKYLYDKSQDAIYTEKLSDSLFQIRTEIADTATVLRGLIPQTLTFSTGLTNTASTITNNLSTGISGGQSVIGGTASGNSLTLSSTTNATKGKLLFGTSAYDEVNNRLGIGTTSPSAKLQVAGDIQFTSGTASGGVASIFTSSGYVTIIGDGNGFLINNFTNSANLFHVNNLGSVKIGGVIPVASAKLEIVSTTQGFLPPRMTATQASAIASPAQGLMLFVTNTNGTFTSVGWWGYNGSAWEKLNN